MRIYAAESANEVWKQLANDLINGSMVDSTDSRLGVTCEILHAILEISDPLERWVIARTPAMNPAFALVEVIWLLTGRDDTAFVTHWFPQYPKYVGCSPRQQGAYGMRLRRHTNVDQIERAYLALRNNPVSRQVVLQIWDAPHDLPDAEGIPTSPDVPCNLLSSLKVRRNRLDWLQIVRSNDIDRGVPYNFVQFTMLQELMAGWLGVEVGKYVHVIDSVHWYPKLSDRMGVDHDAIPNENTDRFQESFESSMEAFEILAHRIDKIIETRANGRTPAYSLEDVLPGPYENMFAIIAADDARRHGDHNAAAALAARCDNPTLRQLWQRWIERVADLKTPIALLA